MLKKKRLFALYMILSFSTALPQNYGFYNSLSQKEVRMSWNKNFLSENVKKKKVKGRIQCFQNSLKNKQEFVVIKHPKYSFMDQV